MQTVLSQKGGHGLMHSMRRPRNLGMRNATLLACDRIQCFAKKVLASIRPDTFVSHTKMLMFF